MLDRLYKIRQALRIHKGEPDVCKTTILTDDRPILSLDSFLEKDRIYSHNIIQCDTEANYFFLMDMLRACLTAGNRVPLDLPQAILEKLYSCIRE